MSDEKETAPDKKRIRTNKAFPSNTFEECVNFCQKILEMGSGQPVRRILIFDDLGRSPDSSASRDIITNSGKYGLTKGSYKADLIELTAEGRKAVDDEYPKAEVTRARVELGILSIPAFSGLFSAFQGSKLPSRTVLIDKVKSFDVSPESAEEAVDTFIVNLKFVGLLQDLAGAERIVSLDHCLSNLPAESRFAQVRNPTINRNAIVTSDVAEFEATVFYITPIGSEGSDERKHSDLFLSSIVEPALESFQLRLVRADRIEKPGVITGQIIEHLLKSRLVIADLSFHNPNVFYELAIRHMTQKPVVQIMRARDRIPFDVQQIRTIIIDDSDIYTLVPKIDLYKSEIASHVRRALEDPDAVENPLTRYLGDKN